MGLPLIFTPVRPEGPENVFLRPGPTYPPARPPFLKVWITENNQDAAQGLFAPKTGKSDELRER